MKTSAKFKVLRALVVLAVGVLLVSFSEAVPEQLVRLLGVLFLIPAAISVVEQFRRDVEAEPAADDTADVAPETFSQKWDRTFAPVTAIGALLFGVLLLWKARLFVEVGMFVLACLLIALGVMQLWSVRGLKKQGIRTGGAINWVLPLVAIGAGVFALWKPIEAASIPLIVLGAGLILYALIELWFAFLLWRWERNNVSEHPVVEEAIAEAEEAAEEAKAAAAPAAEPAAEMPAYTPEDSPYAQPSQPAAAPSQPYAAPSQTPPEPPAKPEASYEISPEDDA